MSFVIWAGLWSVLIWGAPGSEKFCAGRECITSGAFSWFEGGFEICRKPCGAGIQTQEVSCRRNSDNVPIDDVFCLPPKPAAHQTCNAQSCVATYTWNVGAFGACSNTCGGGRRTREVDCQDQIGATVAESFCVKVPKPPVTGDCNNNACPPVNTYSWSVEHGPCSKECGDGVEADQVHCKKVDGGVVGDEFCKPVPKPGPSHLCNSDPCPAVFTYAWDPGPWSQCSQECGDGVQTRSATCKRNDGSFVAENLCAASLKPRKQQTCNLMECPTGRRVTQKIIVTPATNSVDVILIVDDSKSMANDQVKLAARMAGLLADLDHLKIDYQVCLTTTDISFNKGSPLKWQGLDGFIMNKNSPNKNQVFMNTLDVLGGQWSSDEQAIKAMYLLVRDFRASGCIRPRASLAAIMISDENERSVGGNRSWSETQYRALTNENYPDNLLNYVKATYDSGGFKKPFTWNSIVVKPFDAHCQAAQDSQGAPSFYGTLYADLSNKTNGHIGSICDADYAQNLKYIKDRVVNSMPGLMLECVPTDAPKITFDRPLAPAISLSGDQIKFTPALPEGVTVTVVYTCPN